MGEQAKTIGDAEKAQALKLKDEGNALFKKGDHLKAAGVYAKATKVDPTNHVLFSNLAAALLGTGHKFKQALTAADKAIALQPDFPKSHFRRGCSLMGLTREEEAIECFHKTAELDPSNTLVAPKLAECIKLVEASKFGKTPEGIALAKVCRRLLSSLHLLVSAPSRADPTPTLRTSHAYPPSTLRPCGHPTFKDPWPRSTPAH